ncbi:SH3 domain-binding protein 5-like isoform X1 [Magallana gigas]|uniref:SH3 domain-binding protein 5-like n=2 Tax=Magallana gigas TaxID=29159 RepID=A0A8W8NEM7_MAGGI|nr:SH3 domain-binding protein 5-like isoform X2 [Crassostrea gigas]
MADRDGRLSPACLDDLEDESLDPRIQGELERLNKASEEINKLELELDDARASFRQALTDSTHQLNSLAKKLGSVVEKARPYYDARMKAKEAHIETQKAALRFERACSMHEAAKEMVQLAEQGYNCREEPSDPAWQEMLNHATMKVNEAEKERNESEQDHRHIMIKFQDCEEVVHHLQRELKRAIAKSNFSTRRSFLQMSDIVNRYHLTMLPYFEMKAKFNQTMEEQKRGIKILEEDVSSAKTMYSEALRNLETISDEIHQQRIEKRRNDELGERGAGVGSETPSPPPFRDSGHINGEGQNAGVETEEYVPSSVIHPSVEKARNPSYLKAVGDYGEKDEEFPVPSFESEYKSLPDPHKPAFRTRSAPMVEDDVFSDDQRERSQSMRHSKPNPAHLDQGQSNSDPSRLNKAESRKKLQAGGLILKIDSNMDPLAGMYSAPLKPTRSTRSQGKNRSSRKSKSTTGWSPQSSVLSVPSGEDGESSDSESVISTGPMLDDEQVLALTLDFEKVSTDDASPPANLNWRRKSLPPNLSHLEQFLHKSVDDENV